MFSSARYACSILKETEEEEVWGRAGPPPSLKVEAEMGFVTTTKKPVNCRM